MSLSHMYVSAGKLPQVPTSEYSATKVFLCAGLPAVLGTVGAVQEFPYNKEHVFLATLACWAVSYGLGSLVWKYTPEGRMDYAWNIITDVEWIEDRINGWRASDNFLARLDVSFASQETIARVRAYRCFIYIRNRLYDALNEVNYVKQYEPNFAQYCPAYVDRIYQLIYLTNFVLEAIVSDPNWMQYLALQETIDASKRIQTRIVYNI